MRRYKNLTEREVFEAFNKVRNAFLAAIDGNEVDIIIDGLLTQDEKLKIGRRLLIADYLLSGHSIDQVVKELKVGIATVIHVSRRLEKYKECFDLIERRSKKVEKEYNSKKYRETGGSKKVFKTKEYTGFRRKDVKR